jgi:hypothetical protein
MILLRSMKEEEILGEEVFVLRAIFCTRSESRRTSEGMSSRAV